jgi:hypothetical protein
MPRTAFGLVLAGLVLLVSVMVAGSVQTVLQGRDYILQLQQAQAALPR